MTSEPKHTETDMDTGLIYDEEVSGEGTTIRIDLLCNGVMMDVWGNQRLGVAASTVLERGDSGGSEWGHAPFLNGGVMLPARVQIVVRSEATEAAE